MTEYWKSNPRKFCDFCKCWTADNKPSIEFHERGKRHNENVQKRLQEIGEKGKEDYENKLMEDDYMKEMEQAALNAYKKDIEKNPDFTGTKLAEIAESSNAKIVVNFKSKSVKNEKSDGDPMAGDKKQTIAVPIQHNHKWFEAKTPEGVSYYYNNETKESVWEVPSGGFLSLAEQTQTKPMHSKLEEQTQMKPKHSKEKSKSNSNIAANATPVLGPMPKVDPYGNWESTNQPEQEVDLQLPYQPEQEYYAPVVFKRPEVKFTEKVVTLSKSDSGGSVSFKRRKGAEHKKNVRRRVDE